MIDIHREALGHFLEISDGDDITFLPTSGGVNNVVYYVQRDNVITHVLRIYNNGNDDAKVIYEHSVLSQLALQSFSFHLPQTIPSLIEKKEFVRLSTGASACLFKLIIGTLPKLTCVQEIGRVSGELNYAMSKVNLSQLPSKCPNPPYYDLYKVHHAVSRESFLGKFESTAFDPWRAEADSITSELCSIEKIINSHLNSPSSLPISLIHGDLHYDNVLCEGGKVTGLLDFEFCAIDWNAMEIAICLSKYAGELDPISYFDPFITGFAEKGRLTTEEIAVIPHLIILRILSNVIYFIGRILSDEDALTTLTSRMGTYCKRISWIKKNSSVICDLLRSRFLYSRDLSRFHYSKSCDEIAGFRLHVSQNEYENIDKSRNS